LYAQGRVKSINDTHQVNDQ